MAEAVEWTEIARRILDALDIEVTYRQMNCRVKDGASATEKGWLACYASGREDEHASAAINVGDGPARGRYRDMGGKGDSLSLWEYGARYGGYDDWKACRKALAAQAGVKLPTGAEPKKPGDALDFIAWSTSTVGDWCEAKGGNRGDRGFLKPEAVRECGGRLAMWPVNAPAHLRQSVIAFPIFGAGGVDEGPVGWVVVEDRGGHVEKFEGKDKRSIKAKSLTVGGSGQGLLNQWAVARLEQAEVVWKVEGITDMVALHSWIPDRLKEKHVVITNGGGATESVRECWVRALTGKKVFVVGDADIPGQVGSAKWVHALAYKAASVVNVTLPYAVADNHGRDVRDYVEEWLSAAQPLVPGREAV